MKIIVTVIGGLVDSVYADADVEVDVVDLDVSDYPDAGEQEEVDKKEAEAKKVISQEGWRRVW